jgi:integrase
VILAEHIGLGLRVTITPRGKRGVYHADFHFRGKHCRRSLKTTCKKTATRKALRLEQEIEDGTFKTHVKETKRPTKKISDTIVDFITFLKTEGRRRKTTVKYEGILKRFNQFAEEASATFISDVDLMLIDRYRAHRKPGLGENSMSYEGSLLKLFLGWCVDRGLLVATPLANRKFKAPRARARGGPSLDQINEILKTATNVRRPVIAVAAFGGLRIGEIIRLQVDDVDFRNNWLHIRSRPGYETKSGDSWKVPIHSRLRVMLERVPHGKAGWFFTAKPSRKYPEGGHHLNPQQVNENFTKVLESLNILAGRNAGYTFHSLRSSFKTLCINASVPKEVVDIWQNHAPDRAASNVYYKLSEGDSQAFMKKVPFGDAE